MPAYYSISETAFRAWFNNFVTTAATNQLPLGLTPAQVTTLNNAKTAYQNAVAAQITAYNNAEAATLTKDAAYRAAFDLVKLWAPQWQANPSISNELRLQLGLVVRDSGPSPRPVFAVSDFSGSGNGVGTIKLRWKANGNAPGVTYLVQSRPQGGAWTLLAATTKTRIALGNQPIAATEFRVIAERRGVMSDPSYAVVVYGEGASGAGQIVTLQEAA